MRVILLAILVSLVPAADDVLLVNNTGQPEKIIYWRFSEVPLTKVIEELGSELDLPILISPLKRELVTGTFDGVTVQEALRQVLEPRGGYFGTRQFLWW